MSHEKLIADLVEESTPVVPLDLLRHCCGALLAITAYFAVIIFGFGLRADWFEQIATSAYLCEMLITLLLTYGAAWTALRLSAPSSGKLFAGWLLILLSVVMGAVIWLLGQVNAESFAASMESDHFYITLGVIAGATPVAAGLFWLLRQGAPTQLRWAGAMALLSASAAGHFIMRTVGQADNFADVLVWCYSPILVFLMLGVIVGQKTLRW